MEVVITVNIIDVIILQNQLPQSVMSGLVEMRHRLEIIVSQIDVPQVRKVLQLRGFGDDVVAQVNRLHPRRVFQ